MWNIIGHKLTVPILLLYVFLRDFRPSEPFLTPFLNESKNFTKHEINNMIYPVWSYSQLPIFMLVLATTDAVRYRPMIWFGALGYVATWLLLVFGTTVQQMQLMQVNHQINYSWVCLNVMQVLREVLIIWTEIIDLDI